MIMQQQEEEEWCWAAVAVSVDHYFKPSSTWTQEELAANVTAKDPNCNSKPDCPEPLQAALAALERLDGAPKTDSLSFDDVKAAIDKGLPLCVRIGWSGGGAHFVAIDGAGAGPGGQSQVRVKDPFFGDSLME